VIKVFQMCADGLGIKEFPEAHLDIVLGLKPFLTKNEDGVYLSPAFRTHYKEWKEGQK